MRKRSSILMAGLVAALSIGLVGCEEMVGDFVTGFVKGIDAASSDGYGFDEGSDAGWYEEDDYDSGSESGPFFSDYGGSVSWW